MTTLTVVPDQQPNQPRSDLARDITSYRAAAAVRIKGLMANWTANTLALAKELAAVAESFPLNVKRPDERPGFIRWAKKHTGLSITQIQSMVQVHRKFGHRDIGGRRITTQVLFLMAQGNVPESARQELLDRTAKGERVTHKDAKKIVKVHKLPSKKEANEKAKEEGRPVLARDGFIYFGSDAIAAKQGQDRRTMVYGVRKALGILGGINLTPTQFLAYALPHQLWQGPEAAIIKQALKWLAALDAVWDRRKLQEEGEEQ